MRAPVRFVFAPLPDLPRPQDNALRKAVEDFGGRNWKAIATRLKGRTDVQCLHRWQKVLKPGLVKGPWTTEVRARRAPAARSPTRR